MAFASFNVIEYDTFLLDSIVLPALSFSSEILALIPASSFCNGP